MDKTIFLLFAVIVAAQGREIASLSSRIVGGEDAALKDFPHQAIINFAFKYRCTGAFKSEYWVITTSTCLYGIQPERTTIMAGTIDRVESFYFSRVSHFVLHPKFDMSSSANDIALIKTQKYFEEESGELKHVLLPQPNHIVPEMATVTVSGWGSSTVEGEFSEYLQKLDMMVISNQLCFEALGSARPIYDSQLCTIGIEKNKLQGPCYGDYGGPLMEKDTLVGLMSVYSMEPDCGNPNTPTIFTRVSSFVDWINSNSDE